MALEGCGDRVRLGHKEHDLDTADAKRLESLAVHLVSLHKRQAKLVSRHADSTAACLGRRHGFDDRCQPCCHVTDAHRSEKQTSSC